jgi:CRP-like cAMP-binding protein
MLSSDVTSLQQIPMFRDIEGARLKLIALASERFNYRIGDRLLREGDRSEGVFVILDGKARVVVGAAEVRVAEVGAGAVVGEVGVVLDRPITATIIAETPLTALRIEKRTFLDLLAKVPQFSLAMIRELAARLNETNSLYAQAVKR